MKCALFIFVMPMCLLWCAAAGAQAESATETVNEPSSVSSAAALLDYDFTSDLDNQVLVDVRGASDKVDALIGIKAMAAVSRHPKDETILGVKRLATGQLWALFLTKARISIYITKFNKLPECALDLFDDLQGGNAYTTFTALYPTERLVRYGAGVNLATNRFYQDFTDPAWRPGGIYIELLDPLGDGNFQHGDEVVHFGTQTEPSSAKNGYYIKVFSAAENYVLFDDYVLLDSDCND